ncbi:MAG: acetyl-CoA carboxylase, biotin carboxyl carrier protein [Crocinitomicaceae bacterium]|jgi:acetyl-CoA carboxylase biotin carboxyl carrier protein|nr:acetyl-CoA carboxylase, biotin carboxyl carrier protein [Crocinitomicaceae bacterium]|tara:strand:- start:4634 stop:5149 length:516 start_codon:yes stop_codon:yes gene_type:complete
MTITEIQDLIKFIAKAGVTEVEIEKKDFKITIKSEMPKKKKGLGEAEATIQVPVAMAAGIAPVAPVAAAPVSPPAADAAPAPAAANETEENNYITVKSPMIGTFYRRPAPDKDAFVDVGDSTKVGDTICVIEAMKLFNEIESEVTGKIVKILVDDNSPVEYDQPLFLVDPA